MQKESLSVNDSKKTKKKTTKIKQLDPQEGFYCYKERRLCPRDPEEIHQLGDRLWKHVQDDRCVNFEDFCADEGISIDMLRYWSLKNEYFGQIYQRSKLKIGARLDRGIWFKQLEWRNRITMHNYLKRYAEDDAIEDTRKIKLANEGVTNGETRILIVNENKKYEEPE